LPEEIELPLIGLYKHKTIIPEEMDDETREKVWLEEFNEAQLI
jgi:hypothetical protein